MCKPQCKTLNITNIHQIVGYSPCNAFLAIIQNCQQFRCFYCKVIPSLT